MQKVVKVLEKNAEWIAMGIAGLWLVWVVWAYVLTPPTVEVGGDKVSAAQIDDVIFDQPAKQLKDKMSDGNVPEVPVVEYASTFDARMKSLPVGTPGAPGALVGLPPRSTIKDGPQGPETPKQEALLVEVPQA